MPEASWNVAWVLEVVRDQALALSLAKPLWRCLYPSHLFDLASVDYLTRGDASAHLETQLLTKITWWF